MDYSFMAESDFRYPALTGEPRAQGMLAVSAHPSHLLHWEEWGNPDGEPVMLVHGGPGGGLSRTHARLCDPSRYRIILFDQRGCGQSVPHVKDDPQGAMAENITAALVEDMQRLRAHRGLGDRKMHLYGGSWGSTLALAYAARYPQWVENLILRGIFLCDRDDLSFFYQGNAARPGDQSLPGAYRAYSSDGDYTIPPPLRDPRMALAYAQAWANYVAIIPPAERGDMIAAYHACFTATHFSLAARLEAALAWSIWEGTASFLNHDVSDPGKFGEPDFAIAFATIENGYFHRSLRGADATLAQLLATHSLRALGTVATHIVQGAHDQVCLPLSARKLHAGLKPYGNVKTYTETCSGHALTEKATFAEVMRIMDHLPVMVPTV